MHFLSIQIKPRIEKLGVLSILQKDQILNFKT